MGILILIMFMEIKHLFFKSNKKRFKMFRITQFSEILNQTVFFSYSDPGRSKLNITQYKLDGQPPPLPPPKLK